MELPANLRIALEKLTQGLSHSQLRQDSQTISFRYRNESGTGKRLLTKESEAISYAIARMPATYGAVYTSLQYSFDFAECNPLTLLDVGAGTGAATWAVNSLLNLTSTVCLEREDAMRQIGQKLMKENSETFNNVKWIKNNITIDSIPEKADLVVASYVLNELSDEDRIKVVDKLWDATNMMLLIVEPGTPVGYAHLMKARQLLLSKGANLVAPCSHGGECPLYKDDWCHFKCRIPRSRLHRQLKEGEAPYEDEKFIYLALTRHKTERAVARILRHPVKEKGRVSLDICSEDGIKKITVSKKDGEVFKKARKANCGDEIVLTRK